MKIRLNQCFDSHVHLQGTGMVALGLSLFEIQDLSEFSRLNLKSDFFRQDWLTGFGWDQSKWEKFGWPKDKLPTHLDLDKYFADYPVAFMRADGHATWLNKIAMQRLGWWKAGPDSMPDPEGGIVLRDQQGYPTGIFFDSASVAIQMKIPDFSTDQKNKQFILAGETFNKAGFTHVRDMTCNLDQFVHMTRLQQNGQLKLFVDANFVCDNPKDLDRVLFEIEEANKIDTKMTRVAGVKLFVDGSLGSGGAFLSNGVGQLLWELPDLQKTIKDVWLKKLPICIHSIGDQTSLIIAKIVDDLNEQGITGKLHLEHGQVLGKQALDIFAKYEVSLHMQPCHWLSDKRWLEERLGELFKDVFPWYQVNQRKIPLFFGSDSPIELTSLFNNMKAVKELEEKGIPAPLGSVLDYHQHWDKTWGSDCWTEVQGDTVASVVFQGQQIL